MKKIGKLLIWSVLLTFLLSCANKHPDHYTIKKFHQEDVPFSKALKGYKMNVGGLVFPRRLLNLKKYLIVSENKADTLIHIIDKKNGKIKRSIGIHGVGPGEIGMPWVLYPANNNRENEFFVHQLSQKKIDKFNIDSNSPFATETIKFNKSMFWGKDFVFSSDSTFMTVLSDGNDKFVEFDKKGNVIQRFDTWDHMLDDESLPSNVVSSIHQGMLNVGLKKNYFTLACIGVDMIEILNKQAQRITSIRGPIHHVPKFTVGYSSGYPMPIEDRNTIIYCYTNTVFGEKIFYALFSGASAFDVNRAVDGKFNNDIYIFDFEGNVKGHYKLDRTIAYLAVDEIERKFYGLTWNEDPADIVAFDF